MAEYKSSYTGPQIDAAIAKADTAVQPADLSNYQPLIDSSNKISSDLVNDSESTNKFVTASDKTAWSGKQDALVSGTNIKTINNESLLGSGNITIEGGGDASWGSITGTLSDQTDLQNALDSKQASLVSGTNIKTINNESLLGSGNINISGGSDIQEFTPTDIDMEEGTIEFSSADFATLAAGEDLIKVNISLEDPSDPSWIVMGLAATGEGIAIYSTFVITMFDYDEEVNTHNVITITITDDSGSYDGAIQQDRLANINDLDSKQDVIDSSHKLSADLVNDASTTNKFVTASDKTTWSGKQDALVSGTNIKTVNNQSILGSGNITIETSDVVLDSNLVGKKLSLIGDSITTYSGWLPSGNVTRYPRGAITSVEQTWWKKLLNETGMVIGQNCAWDGSTCSGLSTSTTNAYAACSDKRITQLGLNGTPDIIICYIGINDWGATYNKNHTQYGGSFVDGAFVPIGSYTGETALPSGELKTLSEAYGAMVGKIQIAYPLAKIYCCTLPQTNGKTTYNYDADGVFPSVNRDSVSLADYNDCIRMIAKNLGAEVIEFAECGINWGNMTTYMEDGLHPMPDGMTLLCDTAKAKLYSDFGVSVHGGSPTPPTTTYTVTNNLTHVTTNNSATSVVADASYIATLTPDSTYNLQSVSVEMGGVDITSTAYSNGTISIVNVTGNLVITATATAQASYSVTNNLTNVTTSNNTASVVENDPYTATLSPSLHYTMGTVTVEMGGVDITSTAYDNGVITIASVTGNLVITATANAITYTITNTLSHATNSNSDTSVIEGSGYTGTITADLGYTLDTVTITMGGTDITATAYSNGTINIASVTGNIVITVTAVAGLTWYTNFAQTSTNSFVASSKGWALDETTYANIYGKPINKISFVATANSGSMDFCIAPSHGAQTGFTNAQTINWDSSNKSGNIVTIDIPEFTLANGTYLCVYVNTTPATGAACYASGGNAGQFYSYVGASGHSTWGGKGSYSIQMNLGYEPSSNS